MRWHLTLPCEHKQKKFVKIDHNKIGGGLTRDRESLNVAQKGQGKINFLFSAFSTDLTWNLQAGVQTNKK